MHEMPSEIGARAELEVARSLLQMGWEVYVPVFGGHSRVDLVATRLGETLRVQCKSARLVKNVLYFRTCSNTNNRPRPYHGEIDAFGVYSPDLRSTYLIPLTGLGDSACSLRVGPTRNNQIAGIRYASDYEIVSGGQSTDVMRLAL